MVLLFPLHWQPGLSGTKPQQFYRNHRVLPKLWPVVQWGLGGSLSEDERQDHYQNESKAGTDEVESMPDDEMQEVKDIFAEFGIDNEGQTLLANVGNR